MHSPLFADVVVLLVVSIGVLYASHQAGIPSIVGLFVSGVLIGPHGLGLIQGVEEVEQLAEIGVILLLFTIGLEFSLADLLRMRRVVLLGGSIQVFGVIAAVGGATAALGLPLNEAVFLGMLASLSSTAVVLSLFQRRAEVDAPHGRMSLGILVYQDLIIVPMMLLVPVLSGASGGIATAVLAFLGKTAAALAAVLVLARFVVPQLLHRVVSTRSRDLFLLTVVTICMAVAWAAGSAGMSLALGAFLAGLLISESEYSHQALADILPFRDVFASFFFVSVGMLLDLGFIVQEPLGLAGVIIGCLLVKSVAGAVAAAVVGASSQTAVTTGLALGQVGEFSFVLAGAGIAAGLLSPDVYRWFVAAAVVTMALTPATLSMAAPVSRLLQRISLPFGPGALESDPGASTAKLSGHVVVIGYGINGRNVARAAKVGGIPYVAVDMNPTLVAAARASGASVVYGDATRPAFLDYLGVAKAHAVVIAISDAVATRQVTAMVRRANPTCAVFARTRHVHEVEPLLELGATAAIPEELETSIEIVSRILSTYLVPRAEIEAFVSEIRAGQYEMLRAPAEPTDRLYDLQQTLTDVEVRTLRMGPDSALAGKPLSGTDLRNLYGVSVVAIRRGERMIPNPGGDTIVEADDLLVVLGLADEIAAVTPMVRGEPAATDMELAGQDAD